MKSKDHERDAVMTAVHIVIQSGDEGEYKQKNKYHSEKDMVYFDSHSPPSRSTSLIVLQIQHVLLTHHGKG